ncbi:MAG: hypothetical protein KAV42_04940 [Candidatus Krumholzibacteria bacterium]|nr:hypothetical protein [Candidatus Krumholzibacteria bacterium]
MQILEKPVTTDELIKIAAEMFGEMVKAVVDVRLGLVAIDAEMHSDLEALLLENGSAQSDLWGINFYPSLEGDDFLEFDSMINMRPSQGNMSRGVEDGEIRRMIVELVDKWIIRAG